VERSQNYLFSYKYLGWKLNKNEESEGANLKKNWDILIVLDVCRWSFFEQLYEEYLNSVLSRSVPPIVEHWNGWEILFLKRESWTLPSIQLIPILILSKAILQD